MLVLATLLVVAFGGCGSHAAPAGKPSTAEAQTPSVNRDEWPQLWCQAKVGMTRLALARLMGLPTEQNSHKLPLIPPVTAEGTQPELPQPLGSDTWQAPGTYQFNAFYGGSVDALYVQQLDFNGPADALPCATIRTQ